MVWVVELKKKNVLSQNFYPTRVQSVPPALVSKQVTNALKIFTKNDQIEFLAPNGKFSCFCKNSPQICDALTLVDIGAGWNAEG